MTKLLRILQNLLYLPFVLAVWIMLSFISFPFWMKAISILIMLVLSPFILLGFAWVLVSDWYDNKVSDKRDRLANVG